MELKAHFTIWVLTLSRKLKKTPSRKWAVERRLGIFRLFYAGQHYITASAHHLSFHLHPPLFPLWLPRRKVCCYDSSRTLLIWPVAQLIIGEWHYPSALMFRLSPGFHPTAAAPHSLFLSHPSVYLQLPGAIKFPGVLTPCEVAWFALGWCHRIQVWSQMNLAFIIPASPHLRPINMHAHPGSPETSFNFAKCH